MCKNLQNTTVNEKKTIKLYIRCKKSKMLIWIENYQYLTFKIEKIIDIELSKYSTIFVARIGTRRHQEAP